MRTRALLLGAVASLACAGTVSAAQFQGWYVSMEAGVNFVDDAGLGNDVIDPVFLGGWPSETNFDTGWVGMLTFGHAWGNFRAELELAYRKNDIDNFFVGKGGGSNWVGPGYLEEFSPMVNVLYDWHLGKSWSLSVGGGVGADHMNYLNDTGFHTIPIRDTQWAFAWQLIGGVNYAVSDRSALFVMYRYFNVDETEFTSFDDIALELHDDSYDDITKHSVTFGWRYDLYPDETPTAAPAPTPPPEPMPAPAVRQFIVFFGFNRCDITAEADKVLGEAAAAAKSSGAASVSIVGHTDTVGSPSYNQTLSECRAGAAKTNLVGKGIADSAITTSGKGESELMVQTGDGIKEPQNRRATVDLQ